MKLYKLFIGLPLLLLGCDDPTAVAQNQDIEVSKEDLMKRTDAVRKAELRQIKKYIERNQWNMQETGSGLFYQILEQHGTTDFKVKEGMEVFVSYDIQLLTGDTVYTSKGKGMVPFRVGMSHVESGIQEGVQLMSVGDKARFVIPSFLAHGFTGDQLKIPGDMPIVVTLQVLRVQ